jgi:hypothetical protein
MTWALNVRRNVRLVVALVSLATILGACRSAPGASAPGASKIHTSATGIAPTTTTTGMAPATTPLTDQPIVDPPSTIVSYPSPYRPAYDTLQSLVNDSEYIFTAIIEPETVLGGEEQYPLNVQRVFSYTDPRMFTAIFPSEVNAAHLSVGGQYLFFYGQDIVDNTFCIVGGVRGVFLFNSKAQTITRISTNSGSQIPKTQSVKMFLAALAPEVKLAASRELHNGPPVCQSSATGI